MRFAIALAAGVVALTGAGAAEESEPISCDGLGQSTSACVLPGDRQQTIDAQWQRDSHRIRLELPGAQANVSVSVDSVSPDNGTLIVEKGLLLKDILATGERQFPQDDATVERVQSIPLPSVN